MMILIGLVPHGSWGLFTIIDDEFYVTTRELRAPVRHNTPWGWIHLILGIVVTIAGGYVLTGSVFARTIGVIMAFISALAGFAWLPYAPVWGVISS